MTFSSQNFGSDITLHDHWLSNGVGNPWSNSIQNGGGGTPTSFINHPGIQQLQTGGTSSGMIAFMKGAKSILPAVGDYYLLQMYGFIQTQATTVQDYVVQIGFMDNEKSDPTNGCYFEYNRSLNGNIWSCITNSGGVKTTILPSTTVNADNVFKRHTVVINNNQADFYINGTLIGSSTTNIPTSPIGPVMVVRKTVGTTATTAWCIDQTILKIKLKNNRFL